MAARKKKRHKKAAKRGGHRPMAVLVKAQKKLTRIITQRGGGHLIK